MARRSRRRRDEKPLPEIGTGLLGRRAPLPAIFRRALEALARSKLVRVERILPSGDVMHQQIPSSVKKQRPKMSVVSKRMAKLMRKHKQSNGRNESVASHSPCWCRW